MHAQPYSSLHLNQTCLGRPINDQAKHNYSCVIMHTCMRAQAASHACMHRKCIIKPYSYKMIIIIIQCICGNKNNNKTILSNKITKIYAGGPGVDYFATFYLHRKWALPNLQDGGAWTCVCQLAKFYAEIIVLLLIFVRCFDNRIIYLVHQYLFKLKSLVFRTVERQLRTMIYVQVHVVWFCWRFSRKW